MFVLSGLYAIPDPTCLPSEIAYQTTKLHFITTHLFLINDLMKPTKLAQQGRCFRLCGRQCRTKKRDNFFMQCVVKLWNVLIWRALEAQSVKDCIQN